MPRDGRGVERIRSIRGFRRLREHGPDPLGAGQRALELSGRVGDR